MVSRAPPSNGAGVGSLSPPAQDPPALVTPPPPLPPPVVSAADGRNGGSSSSGRCGAMLSSIGFSSNLPVAVVQLSGEPPLHSKVGATMCTANSPGGVEFDGQVAIGVRGSSSSREGLKRSYALTTQQAFGGAKADVPLLGLPAENDWVFYGPENDRTLGMRNILAFDIGRAMGRYASRTQLFELFLVQDGQPLSYSRHYWGVYVLEEKVKRGKDRVDIASMKPEQDLSGGYLVGYENDNIRPGDVTFTADSGTDSNLRFVMHYPALDDAPASQGMAIQWISQFMVDMQKALQPGSGREWRDMLDQEAFADYLLGTELTKNPDGYRGSVYMNKDRGSPLRMGPMWDYNEAFGLCCGYPIEGFISQGLSNGTSGGSAISPGGWRFSICDEASRCKQDAVDGISSWFRHAWQDTRFRVDVRQRWRQLRGSTLSNDALTAHVNAAQGALAAGAALRNYARWAQALHSPVFLDDATQWKYEVNALREWVLERAAWMDWALDSAEQSPLPPGALPTWRYAVVEVTAQDGN